MKQTIIKVLKRINYDDINNSQWYICDQPTVNSKQWYGTSTNKELKPHIAIWVKTDEEVNVWPMPDELMNLEDSSEKLLVYYV